MKQINWEEFVNKNRGIYYSIILNIVKDREEAEDVLQDVYIKIYENRKKYTNLDKVGRYIAFNTALNVYRHKALVKKHLYENGGAEEVRDRYEVPGDEYEVKQYLEELLKLFPDNHRTDCLRLFMEGYTYSEIAKKLSIPMGTVKSQIWLTRNVIKEHIKKSGWK